MILKFEKVNGSKFELVNKIINNSKLSRSKLLITSLIWGLYTLFIIQIYSFLLISDFNTIYSFNFVIESIWLFIILIYIIKNFDGDKEIKMSDNNYNLEIFEQILKTDLLDTVLCWFIAYNILMIFYSIFTLLIYHNIINVEIYFKTILFLYLLMMIITIIIKKIANKISKNVEHIKIDNLDLGKNCFENSLKTDKILLYRNYLKIIKLNTIGFFLFKGLVLFSLTF